MCAGGQGQVSAGPSVQRGPVSIAKGDPRCGPSPECCFSQGKEKGWVSVSLCDLGYISPCPTSCWHSWPESLGDLLDEAVWT